MKADFRGQIKLIEVIPRYILFPCAKLGEKRAPPIRDLFVLCQICLTGRVTLSSELQIQSMVHTAIRADSCYRTKSMTLIQGPPLRRYQKSLCIHIIKIISKLWHTLLTNVKSPPTQVHEQDCSMNGKGCKSFLFISSVFGTLIFYNFVCRLFLMLGRSFTNSRLDVNSKEQQFQHRIGTHKENKHDLRSVHSVV